MSFEDYLKLIQGKIGSAMTSVGTKLNARQIVPGGLGIQWQSKGSEAMPVDKRIATSFKKEGAIAEGDYATAQKLGYSPYIASRADGGIIGPRQMTDNSQAVQDFLKREQITDLNDLNPVQKDAYDKLNTSTPTGEFPGINPDFNALYERARQAYETGKRNAQYAYDRSRGIYDEGMQGLGKKRELFSQLLGEGKDSILDRFEEGRGNLQASAQGAQKRMGNVMRAAGITGGSPLINATGRQTQENMKQLGSLNTSRDVNERENQRAFDSNTDWANTQESSLNRYLTDADMYRKNAEDMNWQLMAQNEGDINNQMGSYFNSILSNQQALDAARGGIGSYSATPFNMNMSNMLGAINAQIPQFGSEGGGSQNVSLNEQDPTYANLLKRLGGTMYK
jgi:hypothetical protein